MKRTLFSALLITVFVLPYVFSANFCHICGTRLIEDSKFCSNCGIKVSINSKKSYSSSTSNFQAQKSKGKSSGTVSKQPGNLEKLDKFISLNAKDISSSVINIVDNVTELRHAAENGIGQAQMLLGEMYLKGNRVMQNYSQAFYWLEKAAEQGVAEAQYNIAVMYDFGKGAIKDADKAIYWYNKALEHDLAEAAYNLAVTYLDSDSGRQNLKLGKELLKKASDFLEGAEDQSTTDLIHGALSIISFF